MDLVGHSSGRGSHVVRDERRLAGARLARAWTPVSRDAAIFGLWLMGVHPLCILIHFLRTRRSFGGLLIGLAWLSAVVGVATGVAFAAETVIERLGL